MTRGHQRNRMFIRLGANSQGGRESNRPERRLRARARGLLAETRKVVVSQAAADSAPGAAGPGTDLAGAGPPARTTHRAASSTTMTWTALAAAVAGTGLLLQCRLISQIDAWYS